MTTYLNNFERRRHASLAKIKGYVVMQRPFFNGTKPCTVFAHSEAGPPGSFIGLPGDIFVMGSWSEDSTRYVKGVYDWIAVTPGARHPEEPHFVYQVDSEDLGNEGWFYKEYTEEDRQETVDADKKRLQRVAKRWEAIPKEARQKKQGEATINAILNGTLDLKHQSPPLYSVNPSPMDDDMIFSILGTELCEDEPGMDEGKYFETLKEPIIDHLPDEEYATKLEEVLVLSEVFEQQTILRLRPRTDLWHATWTYQPSGTISPLQINNFGFGRHVYEIGSSRTLWLFWPPTKHNVEAFAQVQYKEELDAGDLSSFECGFWKYSASNDEKNAHAFLLPPYFIFTTMAVIDYAYISVSAFPFDVHTSQLVQCMKLELELLKKGFIIGEYETPEMAIEAFECAVEGLIKKDSRDTAPNPIGLNNFLREFIYEIDVAKHLLEF
ncbi:hypothetical protein SCHPADRAFT_946071 [Schizopora paradoxa]|uniref:Uncharacterized protein n=1 Tax=Schizopora paradoxa TaxID=27342 RepID=A0A0H2R3V2_9AGAM|nr:hypothetical protein SCHPADRAFT_946071 [Schizopora paradoxa]